MDADQELAAWIAAREERRQRERQAALHELSAASARLAEWQLSEVRLSYDGYGDHGLVEQVTARRGNERVELPAELTKFLSELVERLLPVGWGEHPGAYGEYLLDVAGRSLRRAHHWYVITTVFEEQTWQLPAASDST